MKQPTKPREQARTGLRSLDVHSYKWSFLWGGLTLGAAEAIHYLAYGSPIDITFSLAQAAAAVEARMGFDAALFSRGFIPQVNGIFLGIVAAGLAVTLLERGKRRARYSWQTLAVAFTGGVLSGLGAVLARGDTLYHFIGGVALMQTSSLFMVAFAIPFVFLGLELLAVMGVAGAFEANGGLPGGTAGIPAAGVKAGPVDARGPGSQAVTGVLLTLIFFAIAFLAGEPGPGKALILIGLLAGAGIALSGYGVEWSLLAPDSLASSPRFLLQLGLKQETVDDLRHPSVLKAMIAAVLIPSATALAVWVSHDFSSSQAAGISGSGLDIGHVAGAPLLAIGSVLMIGCEFRNYARMGLGYTTALAALPGLLAGYIPGALWGDAINSWTQSNRILMSAWLPDLISGDARAWVAVWIVFLIALMAALRFAPSSPGNR